jgi:hypothetical protein
MAYLYRHIRKDKDEVFYIGIGSDDNYKRANNKSRRNPYWKTIAKNYGYEIEIMIEDLSWQQACIKETEFINYYGRKDLNKGTLVNMTDGGDGRYKSSPSKETKEKLSKFNKGKVMSQETRDKISKTMKIKITKDNVKKMIWAKYYSWNIKNPILDLSNGIYYKSPKEAALSKNLNPNTLYARLKGLMQNNTTFIKT